MALRAPERRDAPARGDRVRAEGFIRIASPLIAPVVRRQFQAVMGKLKEWVEAGAKPKS